MINKMNTDDMQSVLKHKHGHDEAFSNKVQKIDQQKLDTINQMSILMINCVKNLEQIKVETHIIL